MTSLSVHKKHEDGSSNEVLKITTGSWGLQSVTNEFETFITKIIGKEKMKKFKTDLLPDYLNLIRNFENKITSENTQNDASKDIVMVFPQQIKRWIKNDPQTSIEEVCCILKYSKPIQTNSPGKLKWTKEDFMKFSDKVTKRVIEHIKDVLVGDMTDVETILLVGRLSNVVVNAVKNVLKPRRLSYWIMLMCLKVLVEWR